jgi:hypothetical protein
MFASAGKFSSEWKAAKLGKFLIEQGDEMNKRLEAAHMVRPSASSVKRPTFKSPTQPSMAATLRTGFDSARMSSAAARALMLSKSNMGE